MITQTQDVKSKKDTVGTATFSEYESSQEAVEAIGEAQMLSLLNAQIRTNAMNEVRGAATGKPSKVKNIFEAIAQLSAEELQACGNDEAKIRELVANKQAEMAASKAASAGTSPPEDDDEDDDD